MNEPTREVIPRASLTQAQLERSFTPLLLNLLMQTFLLFALLIGVSTVIGILPLANEATGFTISFIVTIVIALIWLVTVVITYLNYAAVSYKLVPGYIQKTADQILDQIPGKILASEGFFFRNKRMLNMREYDHIRIDKTFLGRYFNYGNIHLEMVAELKVRPKNVALVNVKNPERAAAEIQHMIDLESSRSTPIIANMNDEAKSNSATEV